MRSSTNTVAMAVLGLAARHAAIRRFGEAAAAPRLGMEVARCECPVKGSRCPRGGVNWDNSKFSCNNQILRIAQLTSCA